MDATAEKTKIQHLPQDLSPKDQGVGEVDLNSNTELPDLKIYLQQELLRRCKMNPSYSLRAFARAVGVNHSTLSQIIRGKRALTEKSIRKIGQGLSLGDDKIQNFINSLNRGGIDGEKKLPSAQQIMLDFYHFLSNWHYPALLEVLKKYSGEASNAMLSMELELSTSEVQAMVERLMRLELVDKSSAGGSVLLNYNWEETLKKFHLEKNDFLSLAQQKFRKQLLELNAHSVLKGKPKAQLNFQKFLSLTEEQKTKIQEKIEEIFVLMNRYQRENDHKKTVPENLTLFSLFWHGYLKT